MKFATSFAIGILFIASTGLAPLLASALPCAPPSAQEILIDQWSDADYRLLCKRPTDTILIPAAQANIEGRAGLVTLASAHFWGGVRGFEAPEGAQGAIMNFISRKLDRAGAEEGFEFRSLPMGGVKSEQGFGELLPYLGEQALCVRLLDERPGVELVHEVRIIVRGGTALRFSVTGPLGVALEDGSGFDPFFNAFSLSEGEFKHRATPPASLDFEGPGYQMHAGVLKSGELGLRFETPKGWRAESRMLAMDWSFASHAHFVSPGASARITVGTKTASQPRLGGMGTGDLAHVKLDFAGQQVLVKEVYPTGTRGLLRMHEGVLSAPEDRGDLMDTRLQLVVDRDQIEAMDPEIHRALAGASWLSAAESASIIAQTTGAHDPQVGIGEQAWLRGGTYFHKGHGLRWAPPSGVWIHLVEPAVQYGMDRDTLLMSYCHARNLVFELRAKRTRSKNLERAHRRGLQSTFGVRRAETQGVEVEEVEFLGHKAMRTRGQNLLGAGVLDFTTILLDGYVIHVSASCTVQCSDEATAGIADELTSIRDALVSDANLKAPQASDDRYIDRQFAYSIDLSGEPWTVQPREPQARATPLKTWVQCVREDGLTLTVSAHWVDPVGYLDDPVHARHRGFYDIARSLAPKQGTLVAGPQLEHQGRPVHIVISRDGDLQWETAIIQRGPFVYTIVVWNTKKPKEKRRLDGILNRITLD